MRRTCSLEGPLNDEEEIMIYLSSVYRAGSGWERSIRYQFDGPLEEAIHWMRQERAKYPTVIFDTSTRIVASNNEDDHVVAGCRRKMMPIAS